MIFLLLLGETIMLMRGLFFVLLVFPLLISVFAYETNDFSRCDCEDEGSWNIASILDCQRVSDFLIAVAYFSISIELLYFISCSNVPFKWLLFQFIAFIVLCGMTHLLHGWTYGPHRFQLAVAVTIFKILTALVSCATAITLFTLIPLLLKVKVREFMLKKKARDLGRKVGIIRRKSEAGWHVSMLTLEIRKSLDRDVILRTTLVELSKTLHLQNCAVWMPDENKTEVILIHELNEQNFPHRSSDCRISYANPDIKSIQDSDEVQVLEADSVLARETCGGLEDHGAVAAVRIPMTGFYALLVLVLPGGQERTWTNCELEIVKVVVDQVAVAISHAAAVEESQLVTEKLAERNRALQEAHRNAVMAGQASDSFQKAMSNGMRKPMHSILGLLSLLKDENFSSQQQKVIVDTMMKSGTVMSLLMNNATENSPEMKSFGLHALVTEAACFVKCLCAQKGLEFKIEVDKTLPHTVVGDERRIFQVIFHMVGNLVDNKMCGGSLVFRVFSQHGSQGRNNQTWATWRSGSSDGYVYVRFEVEITSNNSTFCDNSGRNNGTAYRDFSFGVCQQLVQRMQGNMWVVPNPQGVPQSMALSLRLQLQSSVEIEISKTSKSPEASSFKGLQVLLADDDDMNRAVTQKLLEKLGCAVTSVSSGSQCLASLGNPSSSSFHILLTELHMDDLDGFEIATRVRKLHSRTPRNCPLIVALSAADIEECYCDRFKQVGINEVLRKPLLLQDLVDALHRVMQAKKMMA